MPNININISLGDNKIPTKPQPMIDGYNAADAPKPKIEQGFDITANPETYKKWTGRLTDYVVQEGDTLESIAAKFDCKANEIAILNKKHGNMISDEVNVGQRIKVPLNENI